MRRVTAELDNQRPPRRGRLLKWFAVLYFWLAGWKLKGTLPPNPRMLIIGAPHTSNWDGWNVIMASWIARVELKWMIKAEFLRWPLIGRFLRWAGAVPIRRDSSHNVVAQSAEQLRTNDELLLLVAPEGTRRKTDHWKTGFYWIAHQADVPMLCALMDYGTKTIKFTGPYHPTGDIEADIEKIWNDYRRVKPLHPEKLSDMRLRPRDRQRFRQGQSEETS